MIIDGVIPRCLRLKVGERRISAIKRFIEREQDKFMITERQIRILDILIREYIKTAEPVGSEGCNFKKLKVSSATIRNEMKELEEKGYLSQPHTSAGRAPTPKGYKYFIDNLMEKYCLKDSEKKPLDCPTKLGNDNGGGDFETFMKQRAKALAQLTSEAVILTFGKDNFYYTGLTNIFSKPEFRESGSVISLSGVLDELDEAVQKLFRSNLFKIRILMGGQNPFGENCGAIAGSYKKNNKDGVLGIFGPIRMDYERNLSLLQYVLDNL